MPNQSGKILLIIALILLFLSASAYFFLRTFKKEDDIETNVVPSSSASKKSFEASKSPEVTKDYYSKALKINIKVPTSSKVEEKFVDIKVSEGDGIIYITSVGTNLPNVKEYFADLKEKNKLAPKEYTELVINGRDSARVELMDPNDKSKTQRTYFIYDHDTVYAFYTSNELVYPILDQIVQSFEYKPSHEDKF